jgi:hypothetical protein
LLERQRDSQLTFERPTILLEQLAEASELVGILLRNSLEARGKYDLKR